MKLEYSVAEFRKNTRQILNSVDMGAEVIIKRYENKYRIAPFMTFGVDPAKKGGDKTVEMVVKDGKVVKEGELVLTDKVAPKKKSVEQAQKRINKATEKLAAEGLEKMKRLPKEVAPVDSCPHGYAKGFCKKVECNRKYQK